MNFILKIVLSGICTFKHILFTYYLLYNMLCMSIQSYAFACPTLSGVVNLAICWAVIILHGISDVSMYQG